MHAKETQENTQTKKFVLWNKSNTKLSNIFFFHGKNSRDQGRMIQSKFAWKNGWQEREREKKKLLLEKKTVRKCRGCLTCVQQFVTI